MKKRIGVLSCANVQNEVACPKVACLDSCRRGIHAFSRYADDGGADVVGVISCAGCPTTRVPEKILRQVRSLAACGVDAIHLSSCMMLLCPFKAKYAAVIRKEFPWLEIVEGTHDAPEAVNAIFAETVGSILGTQRRSMADLIEAAAKMEQA